MDVGIHKRADDQSRLSDAPAMSTATDGATGTARSGRRATYERAQRRRSSRIATISTVVTIGATVLLVPLTPGWSRVRKSFFDWDTFTRAVPQLWRPFLLNLKIFALCAPLILIVGMLLAIARTVRSPALLPLRLFKRHGL